MGNESDDPDSEESNKSKAKRFLKDGRQISIDFDVDNIKNFRAKFETLDETANKQIEERESKLQNSFAQKLTSEKENHSMNSFVSACSPDSELGPPTPSGGPSPVPSEYFDTVDDNQISKNSGPEGIIYTESDSDPVVSSVKKESKFNIEFGLVSSFKSLWENPPKIDS